MKVFLSWLIAAISSAFSFLGFRACRFEPTCSVYARQAYRHYGLIKASWFTAKRLCRCHPFSTGGYDPLKLG